MAAMIGHEPAPPGGRGEKRQLAIVFADLADSTRLCATMGAERFHALAFDFLRRAADTVEANGGYVARFMGDGLLAYFGYPAAAEDDSVRAIRAALAIRAMVADMAIEAGTVLGVRSGIATGIVILGQWLGTGTARERPVVGDAVNLAARLQATAQPNSILVAESTYRLAHPSFLFEEHVNLVLKGIDAATRAYVVAGAAGWNHRPWARQGESCPMIGRLSELDMLRRNFAAACDGAVRHVAIYGEPGIGKSTLVAAFLGGLGQSACRLFTAAANPGFVNLPFFLAQQFFAEDILAVGDGNPGPAIAEAVIEQAVERLQVQPGHGPLVVIAEDLHWIDPSSLGFLAALADRAPSELLLVCTSRDPLPIPLGGTADNLVELLRLEDQEMAALIRQTAPSALSTEIVSEIVTRAGGVPLFGTELARQRAGTGMPIDGPLPWTLSELLASRLADCGESLRLAQCLAVLGISAEQSLLAELADLAPDQFGAAIGALVAASAIRVDCGSKPRITFCHALVQNAAYDMLLAQDRKALHCRAAELIDARGMVAESPDDLAHHWAAGDEPARAATAYARAGEAHRLRYGHIESERAIELGLSALKRVDPSPLRDRIELELQSTLASVLQINKGYSTQRAKSAANRAKILAERYGELTQRFGGLAGQWMAASSAGDYAKAAIAARQMLAIATSVGGPELLAAAWMAQLTSRFRMGDISGAEQAFRAGESHYGSAAFASRPGGIAQTYGNAALVAVLLGDPAAARARAAFAVRNGRRIKSDYDICFATYMAGMLCLMLGADRMAQRWSTRSLRLATRIGFPQFAPIAQVVLGRAMAGLGEITSGLEIIRSGISGMDTTGSRVGLTLYLSWLAEAECFANQTDNAALTLERALAANPEERFYLPETLRLKARLLSAAGQQSEVRKLLRQAKKIAARAGGRWFLQRLGIDDRGGDPN